jgi:hypothetical protein
MTPEHTFAIELRKWWSFDDYQHHTHSWHSREDFIEKKLPSMLAGTVAVPVEDWRIVVDEDVLIYVVHDHAQYEPDEKKRQAEWEGWFVGRWIKHNKGGWTWHGMLGRITHVAPLPARPTNSSGMRNPETG